MRFWLSTTFDINVDCKNTETNAFEENKHIFTPIPTLFVHIRWILLFSYLIRCFYSSVEQINVNERNLFFSVWW